MPVINVEPKTSTLTNPELQKEVLEGVASSIVASTETPTGTVELHEKTPEELISEQDPGAAAGALFALYGSKFFNIVNQMSNKQLRRLVKALVTYPLEDVFVNTKVPIEMNAYHIGNEMITSRFLAVLANTYAEEEKRKALTEEQKTAKLESESNLTKQVVEITNSNQGEKNGNLA